MDIESVNQVLLPQLELENVLIFVVDSLRYDHTPNAVSNQGICIKTISSSLNSPSGFSSIITGLYPHRHNIYDWTDQLTAMSVFDYEGINTSFWDEDISLRRVLGQPPAIPLAEIKPPFIYIERDLLTHMPYRQEPGLYSSSYFRELGNNIRRIRSDYAHSVDASTHKFLRRLETLDSRGLLTDTLVIFTSDHGELLGEFGLIGHNSPACPELIYVPTVFIHPNVRCGVKVEDHIMRHVDLLPTTLAAMGRRLPVDSDGINLMVDSLPDNGLTGHVSRSYTIDCVWDSRGGHVFLHTSRVKALIQIVLRLVTPDWSCLRFAISNLGFFTLLTQQHQVFGAPALDKDDALMEISAIKKREGFAASTQELTAEVEERLRMLGYLD